MGVARGIATFLFILSIPVALITTNIRFVANEPRVYRYAIDDYGAVAATGIQRAELIRAGAEIRDYFNNGEETLNIRVTQAGKETSLFNPQETQHMKDVKDRFRLVNRAQELSVVYLLAYAAIVVLWAREITTRQLAVFVLAGCAVGMATLGVAAAIGLAGFDSAWTDFHELIFSNDFWRLNPATDHLIQMFPPAFWENIVFFVCVLCAAEAALLMIAAALYLGATSHALAQRQVEAYYGNAA